mmetsp:Transcript_131044/g.355637  ORF Transcript_131044/g.355637 Transcript_131044/m.355637 type:complete len:360 (-) Transcript_131044:301-1380(-)
MIDARYRRYRIRDQRRANHWLRRQTLRLRRRAGHRPDWRQAAWAILQSQGHRVDGCRRVRRRELMARPRGRAADEICPQLHSRVVRRTPGVPLGHGQHREAHGLPTTEPAGEDRHALRRVGLLSVPIRTLRRPVGRVLTGEHHEVPVGPTFHQLRHLGREGYRVDGGLMHGALDQARAAVFPPQVHQKALVRRQQVPDGLGVDVLDALDRGDGVREVRGHVRLPRRLHPGCRCRHLLRRRRRQLRRLGRLLLLLRLGRLLRQRLRHGVLRLSSGQLLMLRRRQGRRRRWRWLRSRRCTHGGRLRGRRLLRQGRCVSRWQMPRKCPCLRLHQRARAARSLLLRLRGLPPRSIDAEHELRP